MSSPSKYNRLALARVKSYGVITWVKKEKTDPTGKELIETVRTLYSHRNRLIIY